MKLYKMITRDTRSFALSILVLLAVVFAANLLIRWINRDIVSIKTVQIMRGAIDEIVSASGVVDAPVYDLGTKIGGRIGNLLAKEGDYVRKGKLLAFFDNYDQARNEFERTTDLYNQQAATKQALDAAKTIYDASRIVAPADGVVAKINYDEGETVIPGSSAITIVNYHKSWINAQIDEIDIANVKIGDKAIITTDIYPNKIFLGEIYWIAPLAELRRVGGRIKIDEESYVFPCKIKFLGDHDELKVNMSVDTAIITRRHENASLVPREAIESKNDSTYVFVVKNNRVYETTIEVGIRSFTSLEALSGVVAGDWVAVSNLSKLKNKGRIKVERK